MEEKKHFKFKGAVYMFDTLISNCFEGETYAVSEKKALNNLTFRCKDKFGYLPSVKLTLQGQLTEVL